MGFATSLPGDIDGDMLTKTVGCQSGTVERSTPSTSEVTGSTPCRIHSSCDVVTKTGLSE
jgi:hypothetical protein